MKEVDLSIKNEYYSQVNNRYIPLGACMPTSYIMFLIYNKIQVVKAGTVFDSSQPTLVYPRSVMPDDYLMSTCNSLMGLELRDKIDWARRDNIPPNQVHFVLSDITNDLIGKDVTKFLTNKSIIDLRTELETGHSVVTSGKFVKSGHAVCACGYRINEEKDLMTHVLVDDPYGDFFSDYQNKNGNNIWFPVDKFMQLWGGWYHICRPEGV